MAEIIVSHLSVKSLFLFPQPHNYRYDNGNHSATCKCGIQSSILIEEYIGKRRQVCTADDVFVRSCDKRKSNGQTYKNETYNEQCDDDRFLFHGVDPPRKIGICQYLFPYSILAFSVYSFTSSVFAFV